MNKESYGIDNIESLSFKEGVRQRISMYLGTDDTDGIYQSFKEIINNSTDEALMGFGDTIEIEVDEKRNEISVRDYGRGIPFGIRENGENVLVSIFSKGHTGGKFNNKIYTTVSGLNGIGSKASCLSAQDFTAIVQRDSKTATVVFHKGDLVSYKEEDKLLLGKTGTFIKFIPDKEVFKNMDESYTYERVCQEIENIAYLNKGVHFIIKNVNTNKKVEYYSKNGIADFVKSKAKKPLMKKPIVATAKDNEDELEIAFMWTSDPAQSYVFVNGLYCCEGGTPITGAKTSITQQIKKLSKKDFEPELIRKGLVFAINCKVQNPSFANQTKTKINNPNLRSLASQAFKEGLGQFAQTPEFDVIVNMLAKFQRAENAANKAREVALQNNNNIQRESKKKVICAEKLADCRYHHDERSELMICEGKSAKGALIKARNSNFTACFDLRGKLINSLKNSEEKIALNEEVKQLHIALGCGLGDKFNIKSLRYGRITIVADMDKDGYAIVCLVLSFFYHYYPQLISAGKIYWGVTPLFKVITKNKSYYAYNDEELKSLPKGELRRFKGIGEASAEDFAATIFADNSHRVKITMKDAEAADHYFDILLGENIEERKEYIFSHADFETLED